MEDDPMENYVMIFKWDNQLTQLPRVLPYESNRFKKVKRLLSILIKFVL